LDRTIAKPNMNLLVGWVSWPQPSLQ